MKAACASLVAAGILLLVASAVWPRLDDGTSSWTEEKSKAYQDVSLQYHKLSFRDLRKEENRRLLDEAKAEFESLKSELDSSRERGNRVATWLRWIGAVLAVVGGISVLAQRDPQ